MNIEQLEKMIAKRANEVVQAKIAKFKAAIDAAVRELTGCGHGWGTAKFGEWGGFFNEKHPAADPEYLAAAKALSLTMKYDGTGWPAYLWRKEEQVIRDELLSKMDVFQRLQHARDVLPTDAAPEAENKSQDVAGESR